MEMMLGGVRTRVSISKGSRAAIDSTVPSENLKTDMPHRERVKILGCHDEASLIYRPLC